LLEHPRLGPAAEQTLRDQIYTWRRLKSPSAGPLAGRLAHVLAQVDPPLKPAGQTRAARLAMQLLQWPRPLEPSLQHDLAVDCENVLERSLRPSGKPDLSALAVAARPRSEGLAPIDARQADVRGAARSLATSDSSLDLPFAKAPLPEGPARASDERDGSTEKTTTDAPDGEPAALVDTDDASAIAENEAAGDARLVADATVFDLFRLLHSTNAETAKQAEQRLLEEGADRRQIALGRELTDPDPARRRYMAEKLPSLTGIDAKAWLLALSRDDDAQVRLTAPTLMGTSNDPEMLDRVKSLGRDDADPKVREQATRLAKRTIGERR
jgi:hypothetical protein